MSLSKQYIQHLEKAWRIVHACQSNEDGEEFLNVSFANGVDCVIHDKINLKHDAKRLAEFEAAVGEYGEYEGLLDRRVGIVFDDRRQKAIIGYTPSFFPLTWLWPEDRFGTL